MANLPVLLDMDEVLVDFTTAALKLHGIDRPTFEKLRPPGSWSIPPILNITEDEFWEPINEQGESFWETLEPLEHFFFIVDELEYLVDDNWFLCTTPSRHPGSYSGKMKWVHDNLGAKFDRVVFTNHKELLAGNCILIDDREWNTKRFIENKGQAILFPHSGNSRHAEASNPVPVVMNELSKLLKGSL